MKILVVGDIEARALWDYYNPARLADVDLIISCGDLDHRYLEFLVTMARCPLVYVHGNHDWRYEEEPPEGCDCIEDKIYRYRGLRILGLGGSRRYKNGPCMYTEREMWLRVLRARLKAFFTGGIDILVTHAPARGWGDLEDLPHRGFSSFNTLLKALRPACMVYGHVHKSYGHFNRTLVHESGTRLINAYEYYYIEL